MSQSNLSGPLVVGAGVTLSGGLTMAGILLGSQFPVQVASGDGAITPQSGVVMITKGTAAALTLAAPTVDGLLLMIMSTTAAAHTVTNSSPGFNNAGAGSDVGTFAAAAANSLTVISYNGAWWVLNNVGVTLA